MSVQNLEKIDNNVLNIEVIPGEYSDVSKLKFTWSCESISNKTMKI